MDVSIFVYSPNGYIAGMCMWWLDGRDPLYTALLPFALQLVFAALVRLLLTAVSHFMTWPGVPCTAHLQAASRCLTKCTAWTRTYSRHWISWKAWTTLTTCARRSQSSCWLAAPTLVRYRAASRTSCPFVMSCCSSSAYWSTRPRCTKLQVQPAHAQSAHSQLPLWQRGRRQGAIADQERRELSRRAEARCWLVNDTKQSQKCTPFTRRSLNH